MTIEGAINDLQNMIDGDIIPNYYKPYIKKIIETIQMELKQEPIYYPPCIDCNKKMNEIRCAYDKLKEKEPSEDAISRQAVLDGALYTETEEGWSGMTVDVKYIEALPPVTPKSRWIPVSERLPEEVGDYITTVDYEKHGIAVGQRYYHGKDLGWDDDCVIAWMPLPEPYEKSEKEEK